eukprot:TRINITY_DN49404_c0_g1_i1.p2 TRINITY_DN49404_c0_g1~~TRINITY_DN49404_c0_g1_i1.p2  ORF type:complete len:298 (-),score=26.55 TRINITY_DN49404_c0_g1_i1:1081-1974(-)
MKLVRSLVGSWAALPCRTVTNGRFYCTAQTEKESKKIVTNCCPTATNPYDLLGVDRNVTKTELKMYFRAVVKEYHPDQGGDSDLFKRLHNAYELIGSRLERLARRKEHQDAHTAHSSSTHRTTWDDEEERPRRGAGSWSAFSNGRAQRGFAGEASWDAYQEWSAEYRRMYGGQTPHASWKNFVVHKYMYEGPFPGDDPKYFNGLWRGKHTAQTAKLGKDFRKYKVYTFIKRFNTWQFDNDDYCRWAQDMFINHGEFEKFIRHNIWFEQYPHLLFGEWEGEIFARCHSTNGRNPTLKG